MESSINKGINYGIPLGVHRPVEQSIPPVLYPVGVGYKKFEAIKNISSFKFRNQKSRRDDMSVLEDFQQFEQKAGLDRHVIPTGFLIAFVLFSTDMSSLRDFIHSKTERCFFYNIRYFLQPTVRDASLTGCKTGLYGFSTERYIPNGMLFAIDDFAVKNNKKAVKQCSL